MKKILLLITTFLFVAVTNLYATPIYVVQDNAISGSDMAGMRVSVELENGKDQTKTWKAKKGNNGRAKKGNVWKLQFNGPNTWYSNNLDDDVNEPGRDAYWEFSSTKEVKSFTIDAMAGNIAFDIFAIWRDDWAETGYPNSDGSGDGWWQGNSYLNTGAHGWSEVDGIGFAWDFDDALAIGAADTDYTDLYGTLKITFDEAFTGLFKFGVDTDKVAPVPEPATMMLLGLGLLGLAGVSRRRD